MLTKIHYLFFLIVGQPDVVQMLYGRAFININIAQICKPMTSQFDDRLIICHGKTTTGFFLNLRFTTLLYDSPLLCGFNVPIKG